MQKSRILLKTKAKDTKKAVIDRKEQIFPRIDSIVIGRQKLRAITSKDQVEWDLPQSCFRYALIGFWPDFISGRFVDFFFWHRDKRFLFDLTASTAIFYCTPDTASIIGKSGLDFPEDFLSA